MVTIMQPLLRIPPLVINGFNLGMDINEIRRARLRAIIDERFDGTAGQMADAIGRPRPNVSGLLSGTRSIGEKLARDIEVKLTLPRGWLDQPSGAGNTLPGPDIRGRVPLISWVQAGDWCEAVDHFAPGDAEEWMACPVAHGPHTYILRVRGESMHNPHGRPSFMEGDLIFVDPDRHPENGALVVVKLIDTQEATFKKLVIEGPDQFLKALNPAWPEPILRINGNAIICGVVILKAERL